MLTPSMTSSSGCYFFQTINFELVSELIQANVYLSNADGNQDFPDFLVSPISRSICSEGNYADHSGSKSMFEYLEGLV